MASESGFLAAQKMLSKGLTKTQAIFIIDMNLTIDMIFNSEDRGVVGLT